MWIHFANLLKYIYNLYYYINNSILDRCKGRTRSKTFKSMSSFMQFLCDVGKKRKNPSVDGCLLLFQG